MNRRWGTAFWGHTYTAWVHVPVPLSTGGSPNPGLALDFRRFASDLYAELQREQIEIIRPASPGRFVTHNLMGFGFEGLDYTALARDLDLVAWDNYPRTQWSMEKRVDPAAAALSHAATRGLKDGLPFWVMEQQAGPAGWEIVGVPPRPGELALWAWQSVAHGADGVMFFRWRAARFGAEQFWHGLLDHDGSTTRRYREISEMGAQVAKVGARIAGSRAHTRAALLLSTDSRLSLRIQPTNPGLDYGRLFSEIHGCLHGMNVSADVVAPEQDLSAYRLVVAPLFTVVSARSAELLAGLARGGGVVVLTFRAGSRDEHNAIVDAPLPGLLRELCGIEVDEYDSRPAGASRRVRFVGPGLRGATETYPTPWCDVLRPAGAEPLAVYGDGHYRGAPAISQHRYGKGHVVYVGLDGGRKLWDRLCPWLCALAEVTPTAQAPRGVEVTERRQGDRRILFLLNHGGGPASVPLRGMRGVDLLGDARPGGPRVHLRPLEVRIFEVTGSAGASYP
jgi:beta-galactosidase